MNNVMARSAPLEPRFMGHVLDYLDLSDRVQDALAVANHAGYWFQKVAVGSAYCQKAADVSELCGKGLTIIDLCALPRSLVESCSSTASSVNEVSKRALFLANDLTGTLNGFSEAGWISLGAAAPSVAGISSVLGLAVNAVRFNDEVCQAQCSSGFGAGHSKVEVAQQAIGFAASCVGVLGWFFAADVMLPVLGMGLATCCLSLKLLGYFYNQIVVKPTVIGDAS